MLRLTRTCTYSSRMHTTNVVANPTYHLPRPCNPAPAPHPFSLLQRRFFYFHSDCSAAFRGRGLGNAHFKCIFKETPWCVFRQIVCKYAGVDKANTHTHTHTYSTTHSHTHTLTKSSHRRKTFPTPRWRALKLDSNPHYPCTDTHHTHPHIHSRRLSSSLKHHTELVSKCFDLAGTRASVLARDSTIFLHVGII